MRHLYIVRGVPGSGKTTFAADLCKAISGQHCEADIIRDEAPGGRDAFVWNEENNKLVHQQCMDDVYYWLKHGWPVVVSNTFCTIARMRPYFEIAKELKAQVTVLHVQARHGTIHENVDVDHYEREWEEYKGELHD